MMLGGLRHNISMQMGARDKGRLQDIAVGEDAECTWMHRVQCAVILYIEVVGMSLVWRIGWVR